MWRTMVCRTKEKMRSMADAEERREFYNCEVIPSQTRVCASYVYANEAGADQPLVTHVKQRICIYESESYLYLNYVYLWACKFVFFGIQTQQLSPSLLHFTPLLYSVLLCSAPSFTLLHSTGLYFTHLTLLHFTWLACPSPNGSPLYLTLLHSTRDCSTSLDTPFTWNYSTPPNTTPLPLTTLHSTWYSSLFALSLLQLIL